MSHFYNSISARVQWKAPIMSADSSFKHFRGSLLKSFISRSHLKVSCGAIAFFLYVSF